MAAVLADCHRISSTCPVGTLLFSVSAHANSNGQPLRMFPISDENPTLKTPVMTFAILVVIWGVWLFVQGGMNMFVPELASVDLPSALAQSVCTFGLRPGELTFQAPIGTVVPLGAGRSCAVDHDAINWLTPLTSMFLHGSWGHILGNSLYLWVFGNNVEDSMGRGRFLAFYLITGVAAAACHIAIDPTSPVPTVGASGAISGVMGGYLLLYPRVRVRTFVPPFFLLRLPAWSVLVIWFGMQVLTGLPQLMTLRPEISAGVAVWAHVGGFVAGVLLVRRFVDPELVKTRTVRGDAKVVWQ